MPKKRINENKIKEYLICNKSKSIIELSKELNISKTWFYKFCKKENINIVKSQPTEKQLKKNPTLKRLTELEWFEIEKEIDSESKSITEISKKFNVSINSIYKHFNKIGKVIKSKHTPNLKKLIRHINKVIKKRINKNIKNAEKEAIKKFKCINCKEKATGFFQGKPLCRICYKEEHQKVHIHRTLICSNCSFSLRISPKSNLINLICPKCSYLIRKQKELKSVC